MTVEAAVSAALEKMQAARLPLQNYFGAREATIFSKRGFPRANGYFLTWETQGELFQLG